MISRAEHRVLRGARGHAPHVGQAVLLPAWEGGCALNFATVLAPER